MKTSGTCHMLARAATSLPSAWKVRQPCDSEQAARRPQAQRHFGRAAILPVPILPVAQVVLHVPPSHRGKRPSSSRPRAACCVLPSIDSSTSSLGSIPDGSQSFHTRLTKPVRRARQTPALRHPPGCSTGNAGRGRPPCLAPAAVRWWWPIA